MIASLQNHAAEQATRPGQRRIVRDADGMKTLRQLIDAVAVAHPYNQQAKAFGAGTVLDTEKQLGMSARPDLGMTVFMRI